MLGNLPCGAKKVAILWLFSVQSRGISAANAVADKLTMSELLAEFVQCKEVVLCSVML